MKKKRALSVLMIADSWHTLDHANDSSIHLALVARHHFNIRCFWTHIEDVFLNNNNLYAKIAGELVPAQRAIGGDYLI